MKILVLGGSGMLGHRVYRALKPVHDVYATFRGDHNSWSGHGAFQDWDLKYLIGFVDAYDDERIGKLITGLRPEVVINCIGIVKQRAEGKQAIPSIRINALFPHLLAAICRETGARLIHLSTDCVFSGRRGMYTETDIPDPVDLYGRSKLLGEVSAEGCLTLRTSIIGWELASRQGLLEWFAGQRQTEIKGFRRAIYTGLSTATAARLIKDLIELWPDLSGLYQVASTPINKYDLLLMLREKLGWSDIVIQPDDDFFCDRSLLGRLFSSATGWTSPTWDEMTNELSMEWPMYKKWRKES